MVSNANSMKDFFRINFVGKPCELNKLIYDNSVLLENEEECMIVLKAVKNYKGFQHLGQIMTFNLIIFSSIISKKFKFSKNTQLILIFNSFLPFIILYIYSHFTYWHLVRDLIIKTRKRSKNFEHLENDMINEYQIILNQSKDHHKKIQNNYGFLSSIIEVLKFENQK